jgi:Restriction endonuclease
MADIPKWKRFERLIHQIHDQYAISGATIELDDHIYGQDSKTLRQIDISIRTQVGPYAILITVECKDHAQPLDVGDVGSFATLRSDVRANKGVMIATGGFTPAAVELARTYGIDTRTYLDTESEDWGTEITVPIVLERTKLVRYSFKFSNVRSAPFLPLAIRTDIPVHLVELQTPEGDEIGPLILLLGQRWNYDASLHDPGEHSVILIEHAVVDGGQISGHARIEAHLIVEKRFYTGPLGVHLIGFRDEQDESIHTNQLLTDAIEPWRIEGGLEAGWHELEELRNHALSRRGEPGARSVTIDGTPLETMMIIGYVDALPETREQLSAQDAFSRVVLDL